ncbi:arabinose efflux permease family protein [Hoeflea sp. IMCC20628]|uniref:MFS transporter n=1 Tax=Hoeflea sp. IMCC20628 TaxID=1620421 RepID=UPI00063BDC41|nr:MFS transporter [Hoeflea sp. IMCC20628]AKI01933.1 arabinose efflux permease family protein [Hoeflea sp. IMCC20628]
MTQNHTTMADDLPDPKGEGLRAHLAFAMVLVATCAVALESMAVTVALPAIAREFDVSAASATWVMGMSQFIIVALLLPMASLADTIGYRRLYLSALLVFSLATVACIAAPSFNALVVARAFQSIGTAGSMSVGFAMARTIYADKSLGRSIGFLATTVALASSGGPAISGVLLEYSGWRAVFGLMLFFSTVAYVGGLLLLPANRPSGRRFNLKSSVLVALTLSCLLFVLNGLANDWARWSLALAGLASAVGFMVLGRTSKGRVGAVFPLDLLALPVFSLSIIASICVFAAQSLGFVLLPFYLLNDAGLSPMKMAAVLSIWPLTTALLAPFLGWISDSIPAGPVGAAGLGIYACGFFLLAAMPVDASATGIALRLALCGIGFAVFQTPNNRLVMLSAPRERSGAASAMISLARQFGRASGTAIAAFALATSSISGVLVVLNIAGVLALVGAVASMGRAVAIRAR